METLKQRINKKTLSFIILTISIILFYIFIESIRDIINILLVALVIANILNPLKNILCKKYNNQRVISASIIVILIIVLFLCMYFVFPLMYKELTNIDDIIYVVKKYMQKIEKSKILLDSPILTYIYGAIKEKFKIFIVVMGDRTIKFLMAFGDKIISYAIVPILVYYFLSDRKTVAKWILRIIPTTNKKMFINIYSDCNRILGRYLLGQIVLSIIIFVLTLLPLFWFKVRLPIWLAAINGLLNIIPYFGPIIGIVIIVSVSLISSRSNVLLVVIALIIIQQIEGNILSPKVISDSTNIHPLIIIILLLIGEKVGGFIGMILAVPIGVIIKITIHNVHSMIK